MLKKIKVTDVRLGMYLHGICGKWIEHPFWKRSFKIEDQNDLETLLNCGLEEVLIDTSKGLDAKASEVKRSVSAPKVEDKPKEKEVTAVKKVVKKSVSLQEELVAAKRIHKATKEAVKLMFDEVRMGKAVDLEEAAVLADEISQSMERNSSALLNLARLKNTDEYTYLHSVAVCILMIALGKQLGMKGDTLKQAGIAGLLHDVGKMSIPSKVLNKPGRLTDEEFKIVKSHPQKGWEILNASFEVSEQVLDVCLHHHERVDGKGYPHQLSGDALSLFARMGAVCDVYDAISSDRCYKKGWSPAESIRKMAAWKDGHFDEKVFHAFVKTIGIYPNGTLLKLESGRLGVVIEQSEKLIAPLVKIFFSVRANAHIPVEIIDLSESVEVIASIEDPSQWKLDLDKVQGI